MTEEGTSTDLDQQVLELEKFIGSTPLFPITGVALAALAAVDWSDETTPKAYLQYLLFDENWVVIDQDAIYVPSGAATQYTEISLNTTAASNGYLYVYLVNESEIDVHFDNLTVSVLGLNVLSTRDYYPYGSVAKEWINPPETFGIDDRYRYGYQGQYAEEDTVTGWSHFQLREYDAKIGRATNPDPARQFASPYVWVGNNPISGTDPTGGWCPGGCPQIFSASTGDNMVYKDGGMISVHRLTATATARQILGTGRVLWSTLPGMKFIDMGVDAYQGNYNDAVLQANKIGWVDGSSYIFLKGADTMDDAILRGVGNGIKGTLGGAFTSYQLVTALSPETRSEVLQGVLFEFMATSKNRTLNAVNGVLQFEALDWMTPEIVADRMNLMYWVLDSFFEKEGFDIMTNEGLNAAKQFLNDNGELIHSFAELFIDKSDKE